MSSKRILVNVLTTYTQTAVSVVVGIFTSRWVYLALGEIAFGLFAVVGSVIGFISFLNSTMVSSSTRFFAVAIGSSKQRRVIDLELPCQWFNTALSVYGILSVILVMVGYPIGVLVIRHVLSIPPESLESCIWVFRFSLLAAFTTMVAVPFNALYTAKQLIFVRNIFGILQTLAWAGEAWWILHYEGDRLFSHAAALMLLMMVLNSSIVGLALRTFPECRIKFKYWFDSQRLKQLFSFAAFSLLGSLGSMLSSSGVAMVVNVFFGPSGNAAMGVGSLVSAKTSMLSSAMNSAVLPEVATRMGAKESQRAVDLGVRVCFYSVALPLLGLMPVIVYINEILQLWLKTPPVHAAEISVILLFASMILSQTSGYRMLIDATGRNKAYQISTSGFHLLCVVIVWLMLKCDFGIVMALGVGWIVPKTLISAICIMQARRLLGIPIRRAVNQVIVPLAFVTGASWSICSGTCRLISQPLVGFVLTIILNAVVVLGLFWMLLSTKERHAFGTILDKMLKKVAKKVAGQRRR